MRGFFCLYRPFFPASVDMWITQIRQSGKECYIIAFKWDKVA